MSIQEYLEEIVKMTDRFLFLFLQLGSQIAELSCNHPTSNKHFQALSLKLTEVISVYHINKRNRLLKSYKWNPTLDLKIKIKHLNCEIRTHKLT